MNIEEELESIYRDADKMKADKKALENMKQHNLGQEHLNMVAEMKAFSKAKKVELTEEEREKQEDARAERVNKILMETNPTFRANIMARVEEEKRLEQFNKDLKNFSFNETPGEYEELKKKH